MIIDTSAIVSIALGEPDAVQMRKAIRGATGAGIGLVSLVEAATVLEGRLGRAGSDLLDDLIDTLKIELLVVDADVAKHARAAIGRFGKGHHPARLNLGDLFSYGLAKSAGRPLLFKGKDFSQTDITQALPG